MGAHAREKLPRQHETETSTTRQRPATGGREKWLLEVSLTRLNTAQNTQHGTKDIKIQEIFEPLTKKEEVGENLCSDIVYETVMNFIVIQTPKKLHELRDKKTCIEICLRKCACRYSGQYNNLPLEQKVM